MRGNRGAVFLVIVVHVRFALFKLHALEDGTLDTDMEVPLSPVSERNPVESHFPAMQVPAESKGRDSEFLGLDIEASTKVDREFIGDFDIA